ncbi:MAG: acetyl-CoA carboxylase biotin carboxylase subunit [Flavobacteriaceae bacterium]
MFDSVLIANRGEIALRVIRTARRMGLRTVAVYSDADARAPHVRAADQAVHIGPAAARESYLVAEKIIDAAKKTGAAAIHPGYGFLSENAGFAEACAKAGIIFVGPPPSAIRAMGLKDESKALMEKAGVPVVPGYHGATQDAEFLREKAYQIGYPVLIKAVAGGGGKGMRRVDKQKDFDAALAAARREAASAFGDERVLIERYVSQPRHVEIQVFADSHGNAVHLFERDCSLQRRHQKVIEEAPAPGMSEALRAKMGEAAVTAAKAVGYQGAGTVEFIADSAGGLTEDGFFFMEMNTRLQVEHPVTEAITGVDLVEWQFRVANGETLPKSQDELAIHGHAAEARLYAEDPAAGFLPSIGRLQRLDLAKGEGIRIDAGVEEGGEVSAFYDPMIAKVIAHGPDRATAMARLHDALAASTVIGPKTNLGFLANLVRHPDFLAGDFDTGFIDQRIDALTDGGEALRAARVAAIAGLVEAQSKRDPSPWGTHDGFMLSGENRLKRPIVVDGEESMAEIAFDTRGIAVDGAHARVRAAMTGGTAAAASGGWQASAGFPVYSIDDADAGDGAAALKSPMHGKLLSVSVEAGQRVEKGEAAFIVEAMKMEHTVRAPRGGTVQEVRAEAGSQVAEGAVIVVLGEDE